MEDVGIPIVIRVLLEELPRLTNRSPEAGSLRIGDPELDQLESLAAHLCAVAL
jgi:hypothetical protein